MTADAARSGAEAVVRPNVSLAVVVAIACAAQFMVVLDVTIVNVALPDMRRELGLSTASQQWVISGYLVTFGGFLLLAARASDLLGRKRVFVGGLGVFTVASLIGGLADSGAVLLAARVAQGIGGAALAPGSLGLITASHPGLEQRTRALSLWSIAASSAAGAGLVLGGALTEALSWRWVLFVNVPIGLVLMLAAVTYLRSVEPDAERRPLDIPGGVTVTAGMGTLIYGISRATDDGWGSAGVIVALLAAVALLASFVVIERRSRQPLIPLEIFAHHNLRTANLSTVCIGAVMTAMIFILSIYLQQLMGYGPLKTGLALVPWTLTLVAVPFVTRRLIHTVGPRRLLTAGALISAAGLTWMAWLPTHPSYLTHILGPTIVFGIGVGAVLLPSIIVATGDLDPRDAGLASGLVNMSRQLGGAVGLALLVTVATAVTDHSDDSSRVGAAVHGYHVALLVGAGLAVVAAAIAWRVRDPVSEAEAVERQAA